MGCHNSKLNPDILAIPPKLRPLLWRKVEEMRRRRNGAVGSNISKKVLLTDGEAYLPPSTDENESSKSVSQEDSVSSPGSQPIPEKIAKEDENEERNGKDEKRDIEVVKAVAVEKVVVVEEEEERNICPGSPSFRVYFIESLVEKEDKEKNEGENDMHKKWSRTNSVDSIVLTDSSEDPETKIIKKRGKNRMRITRAICKGPVAVKHLLSVTSCYHPNNEASLLTRKSVS